MNNATLKEVKALLHAHIVNRYGSQAQAAKHWGVTQGYVSKTIHLPDYPIPEWMLCEIGATKHEVTYYTLDERIYKA